MVAANEIYHMQQVMDKIQNARQDIIRSLDALLMKRESLSTEIDALQHQLAALERLSKTHRSVVPIELKPRYHRSAGDSLSRRVVALMQGHHRGLTFHDIRERLSLDARESRNLGPVLNQMAKTGKIVATGRGMPWLLPTAMPLQMTHPKPDQSDQRDWQKAKDLLVKGTSVAFETTDQTTAVAMPEHVHTQDYSGASN